MCCVLFKYLYRFLQSVEGGSKNAKAAEQEAVDLAKFLHLADKSCCDITNVRRMANVVRYLNKLRESKVGPSGQITKLNTLSNALKMLMSTVPEDGGDEKMKDMAVRISVIESRMKEIAVTPERSHHITAEEERPFRWGMDRQRYGSQISQGQAASQSRQKLRRKRQDD